VTGLPHIAVRHHVTVLIACIVLAILPGLAGSAFSPDAWYAGLEKPALTPPGWVFPIAWTALYISIGIALFIYLHTGARDRLALIAFGTQLVLNGLWSYLMFGRHEPGVALVDIALLWVAIVVTAVAFARRSRTAGLLLVPYLAWVSFASYLNIAIWRAN